MPTAPIFVFIHGSNWFLGSAKDFEFSAEMFVNSLELAAIVCFQISRQVKHVGGNEAMATQVRRAIVWVYKNAASFDGDPERIYICGHSSGGHLCGVALITDWGKEFAVPSRIVKGSLLISGMYEMMPVRLSWRGAYVNFADAMADAMSAQRHIDKLSTPVNVAYGSLETPDFRRQNRDFAAAVKAGGKPVRVIEGLNY
jgi:arylformamidase